MSRPDHQRVKELFLELAGQDPRRRAEILDRQCRDDPALRAEVESLLAHDDSRTILETRAAAAKVEGVQGSSAAATLGRAARLIAGELSANRRICLVVAIGLAAIMAAGFWSQRRIQHSLKHQLRNQLLALLDADVAALELWLDEQLSDVARRARQDTLRAAAGQLATLSAEMSSPREALLASPAQAVCRAALDPFLEQPGSTGFYLLDRAGVVLAAHDEADVGQQVNAAAISENARVLHGGPRVIKPYPQGAFSDQRPSDPSKPRIAFSAPVRDEAGQAVATLSLGMRADHRFTHILSVGRLGKSGETYAFDERGRMLTESRFGPQLQAIGLVPDEPGAGAIFNVEVRDPGVDLTLGNQPPLPLAARPLTRAAALAIAGQDGVDVDGYRDYRGVTCIGAWRWLKPFDFGVVTEVDYAEAYAPLRYPLIVSWVPLVLLGLVSLWLLYWALRIVTLQRQIGLSRTLGSYTLEEKIGSGGIGVVYRARHALLQRPTAIKLLRPEQMSATAIARFEREVQLASQLTHPNTIEIYDFGRTPDGVFYYAMEYLPGVSLAQLIAIEGAVPPARAVHFLKQVLGSLREAHALGLVHRDIKPHNIMLCQRGGLADVVKVLDFGLVKSFVEEPADELTSPSVLTGTPLYVAPEQLKNPQIADPRADLYSLGAVGYNLVTGRSIFTCESQLDILYHTLNVMPVPPAELNPAVPPGLDRLLMACLAKDPAQRPATAGDLLAALATISDLGSWTDDDALAWWAQRGEAICRAVAAAGAETLSSTLATTGQTVPAR